MRKLCNTMNVVKNVLEEQPYTRNNDNLLYLAVLDRIGRAKNLDFDITSLSVPYFLRNIDYLGLPHFETVRRTRQMVQAKHPELQGNAKVRRNRALLQEEYRKFAKS